MPGSELASPARTPGTWRSTTTRPFSRTWTRIREGAPVVDSRPGPESAAPARVPPAGASLVPGSRAGRSWAASASRIGAASAGVRRPSATRRRTSPTGSAPVVVRRAEPALRLGDVDLAPCQRLEDGERRGRVLGRLLGWLAHDLARRRARGRRKRRAGRDRGSGCARREAAGRRRLDRAPMGSVTAGPDLDAPGERPDGEPGGPV